MSGDDPDDVVLAGEYVLGLLDPREAAALEREARTRPALAAEIVRWEARLAPLLAQVPAVPPPPGLWRRLEASAHGSPATAIPAPRTRTPQRGGWNGLTAWRIAASGFAVAAAIAGLALLRPSVLPVPVAALQPTAAGAPAIVAELLPDGRLALRPLALLPVAAGHDLELWALPDGASTPVPLGVLPPGGTVLAAAPHAAGRLLVSLEPPGGSPSGLPTGAVLWAGAMRGTQ